MGSLMAGWDSPFVDPERVNYERNKSFTREEIETFWKQRKAEDEAYCKEARNYSNLSGKQVDQKHLGLPE
ncbi:hypothetical protein EJ110_NYTH02316 [Nymphaea thermarum]|nr:hypothetical protein EJ110_NYTH02316 [Nymphaea thermarum]